MTHVETDSPLQGAAYMELYEKLRPFDVATPEGFVEFQVQVYRVMAWASFQEVAVCGAYTWALNEIIRWVDNRFRQHKLSQAINEARSAIPKVPDDVLKGAYLPPASSAQAVLQTRISLGDSGEDGA